MSRANSNTSNTSDNNSKTSNIVMFAKLVTPAITRWLPRELREGLPRVDLSVCPKGPRTQIIGF